MTLAEWITGTLESVPALAGRVYPVLAPEDAAAPYAVYSILELRHLETLDASLAELARGSMQVLLFAESYLEVWALERQVKEALVTGMPASGAIAGFLSLDAPKSPLTSLYAVTVRAEVNYQHEGV